MALEPLDRLGDHGFERAAFGKQVAGAGDDLQRLLSAQPGNCLPIELDDGAIGAADDQQGRDAEVVERAAGEIRPAAATRAAAAPVLAPNNPSGRPATPGARSSQRTD